MKGFLKELQESNATGAVQVVRTLSGSVKQPELDLSLIHISEPTRPY